MAMTSWCELPEPTSGRPSGYVRDGAPGRRSGRDGVLVQVLASEGHERVKELLEVKPRAKARDDAVLDEMGVGVSPLRPARIFAAGRPKRPTRGNRA
jgi:hypothetical protein